MAVVSVLLAFVAFVGTAFGLVFTLMPIWGSVFSFGAPVLALIGIVVGGLAMSAANKRGQSSGFALSAVVMNVLAFLPALVVAMTCGLCNACVTTQGGPQRHMRMLRSPSLPPVADAGTVAPPPPFPVGALPNASRDAGSGSPPPPIVPDMPPPPMAPGPAR